MTGFFLLSHQPHSISAITVHNTTRGPMPAGMVLARPHGSDAYVAHDRQGAAVALGVLLDSVNGPGTFQTRAVLRDARVHAALLSAVDPMIVANLSMVGIEVLG